MKTKILIKFWKDEESSLIVDILEKGSENAYESDMLSNTDTNSNSNCSEYLPTTSSDNESIKSDTDNESIKSDTSGMFPPLIKIHPGTYHIKKLY